MDDKPTPAELSAAALQKLRSDAGKKGAAKRWAKKKKK